MINKQLDIILLINYFLFPLIGWYFGGILFAIFGLLIAYLVDIFAPKWKHELTWKEIDIALNNIYRYGNNPCELCFRIGDKKIFVYRDEKGSKKRPIRMSIRLPLEDWSFLFEDENFHQLIDMFGGKGMYHKNRGLDSYGIFPRDGLDGCKHILKHLFEKSIGGLRPNIYANSVVSAKKNIWIEHTE